MEDVLREAPFALLRLQWRVLKPITDVPAMTGSLWSAMWRFAYEEVLGPREAFCNLGIVPMPADRHRRGFRPGLVPPVQGQTSTSPRQGRVAQG